MRRAGHVTVSSQSETLLHTTELFFLKTCLSHAIHYTIDNVRQYFALIGQSKPAILLNVLTIDGQTYAQTNAPID